MLLIPFSNILHMSLKLKNSSSLRLPLIVFSLFFIIFLFTSDGHRYTFDEDLAAQQAKRIATFSPDPSYVQGESREFFEYPWLFPPEHNTRSICQNAILCSQASVLHSLTQVPFMFINYHLNFLPTSDIWTIEDFDDFHYVSWRNDIDSNFTFMELTYGPFFSALSVVSFFLISRSYSFSIKSSLILVFLFGLSTMTWAYSQTSLNAVPATFFILSGFLFYRKFQLKNSHVNLILTGIFLGLAFLTRNDSILFIIPFFIFILITLSRKNTKLKTFFSFVIPTVSSYLISKFFHYIRTGADNTSSVTSLPNSWTSSASSSPYLLQLFGILFSPGAGLFIFSPILIFCFVGFFDFYKKNKFDCLLIITFVSVVITWFAAATYWHGFNGWGPRYLLPLVAFLILPLGASIEKRTNIFFKTSVVVLGVVGVFINLVYLLQDVSWFVWGFFGSDERGLYSLARKDDGSVFDLWINPVIIWTFEFSQITQSSLWLFSKPQFDIYLLKILGTELFLGIFVISIAFLSFLLLKSIKFSDLTR